MPNGKTHALIGIGSGVAGSLYFFHEGLTGLEMTVLGAGGGVGGYLGAKLPDVFEPATSPHHRKFAHSASFNASVATVGYAILDNFSQNVGNFAQQIHQKIAEAQDGAAKLGWSLLLFVVLFGAGFVVGTAAGYGLRPRGWTV
jgi:hypothetical protein